MAEHDNGRVAVTLRLPRKLIARFDQIRESQPIAVPRNTWIAEAVVKRVEGDVASTEKFDAQE